MILTSSFFKCLSLADGLVPVWCNAFCSGLFATNVITLDLSALIRSNPKCIWNGDGEIAQRMLIISVHLAHIFNCWTLVAPKVCLSPCCDYGWLACTLYRATATHAAATRYPVTSWPTIPRDTGLQHSCAIRAHRQAPEQQLRTRPVGHWTRVKDSRTVASTVTRTLTLLWWSILYVPVDEHIQRSYTVTSKFAFIAYWSNW